MAARLLALATLSPLLLAGAGAVSESDLYDDGRKHVPTAVLAERWRQLEAARCAGQDAQPLLWRGSVSNSTVYLLATYPVPNEDMLPLSPQVQNALECADVAFFELACSPDDLGNYMAHCFHYSAQEAKDNVPARISPEDLQELQVTIAKVVQSAPPDCAALAANLTKASQTLTTSRQTLRAFYQQALRVLHPSACKRKSGTQMYTESLRGAWGATRPIFGLRDIATECAVYGGNSENGDQELARKMVTDLSNDQWRANMTNNQEAMEDILHCGDLGRLKTMPGVAELPNLGEKYLGQRNQELAQSVMQGIADQPGKTLLVVLGITHFLDWGTMKSVKTLIQEQAGMTFQRITTGTDLSCTASSYSAPGAKELGRCLLPPWRSQPPSCDAFTKAFKTAEAAAAPAYPAPNKTLGLETMGRTKKSHNCSTCVSSDEPCECGFTWENDTSFADLCNRTTVDGVHGMVIYMDLTRNPGSVHKGPGLAEKTVKGLYQSCIASSCDIGFHQDIALRHWYAQETGSQLAGGIVTLRFPGQHLDMGYDFSGAIAAWPWWVWLLFVLVLSLCVAGLVKLFMMPKKKKAAKRAMQIGDPQMPPPVENHFQKVGTDSRLDESLDRPPSPDRYDQSWQPMQQQQQQQPAYDQQQYPPQQQQQPPPGYPQGGPMGAPGAGRMEEGWPWPTPQPGTRAFTGMEPEPLAKGPTWQPQLDFAPPLDQPSPFQGYDNAILAQAMQMQQALGDAGAHAVQQMQQQAQANWQRQNMPGGPSPMQTMQGGPSPLQTMQSGGGSYSLQPGSLQMQAFGAGQPGQPPFSGPFPNTPPLSVAGAPGQFLGPPGVAAPLFGQPPLSPQLAAPPSPPRAQMGGMYPPMGQAATAPMPYPYARMA